MDAISVGSRARCHPERSDGSVVTPQRESWKSVLIVEDEPSIRDVLLDLFSVDGVAVHTAGTLGEAKRRLLNGAYDLVLTDIRLGPNVDGGFQVIGEAGILLPKAMIIALTAYPDDLNCQAALRLGASHFLEKPVSLERIAELGAAAGVPSAMRSVANC